MNSDEQGVEEAALTSDTLKAERDRLHSALIEVEGKALQAGGGVGWGVLAAIVKVARAALAGEGKNGRR